MTINGYCLFDGLADVRICAIYFMDEMHSNAEQMQIIGVSH